MPNWNAIPGFGLGWLIALIGLILVIIFWAVGHALSTNDVLGLFALAFLSRLIP